MVIDEGYFIKYLKNELTEEETRKLVAWVKENRENEKFLFSLKDAYTYLNYEKDRKEADTEREWQRLVKREGWTAATDGAGVGNFTRSWRRWLAYAAVVLVCVWVGWQVGHFAGAAENGSGETILETDIGQQARATLPDGSVVLLNACSRLTYVAGDWERRRDIHLEGEAIFEVEHRAESPFLVHTRHYDVQVLGTCFNVSAYEDEAEAVVTLKQGKVEIYAGDPEPAAVLSPGESFVYDYRTATYSVNRQSWQYASAWEKKQLVFEGNTLEQKKGELFRRFGYRFSIAPGLDTLTYKATLRDESLDEFLKLLHDITPQLVYEVDGDSKTVDLKLSGD